MRLRFTGSNITALVDIINVYKVDPVVALGMPATGKPDRENHPHPDDG